jgi:hypothetical protein
MVGGVVVATLLLVAGGDDDGARAARREAARRALDGDLQRALPGEVDGDAGDPTAPTPDPPIRPRTLERGEPARPT